jgi:Holliday junction resolvasome RuvABC endonuclease subunit
MMAILAIDPGTLCGWALSDDEELTSGVWDLSAGRGRPHKTRWLNLWSQLHGLHVEIDHIVYEQVMGHPRPGRTLKSGKKKAAGTNILAAHVYGGLVAVLEMWAEHKEIKISSINSATVKKWATGKGNAKKAEMIKAAKERWPDFYIQDDNEADALWILDTYRWGHNDRP